MIRKDRFLPYLLVAVVSLGVGLLTNAGFMTGRRISTLEVENRKLLVQCNLDIGYA